MDFAAIFDKDFHTGHITVIKIFSLYYNINEVFVYGWVLFSNGLRFMVFDYLLDDDNSVYCKVTNKVIYKQHASKKEDLQ